MTTFDLFSRNSFKTRVMVWARKLDVDIHSVTVRSMKTKWASCSTRGRFTFDLGLIRLPPDLQDFVIVHELLHFHVPNHGKLWKSLMAAHLGDYQTLEKKLEKQLHSETKRRQNNLYSKPTSF